MLFRTLMLVIPGLMYAMAAWPAETVPIRVDVGFEVDAISHGWSAEARSEVINRSRAGLAEVLQEHFEHWDFRTDPGEHPVALVLRVVDPDPDDPVIEADLRLEARIRGEVAAHWQAGWLLPTDIQFRRYPSAQAMPDALRDRLTRHFIDEPRVDLAGWLRDRVPLGSRGAWLDPEKYRIVLSIPEQDFGKLRWSIFKIAARPEVGMRETLKAHGINFSAPWPVDAATPRFDGLVVQAVDRCVGGELRAAGGCSGGQSQNLDSEVHRLQLGPVYLLLEQGESGADMDIFLEDD